VDLIREGDLDGARATLDIALEYNPRFSEAHANMGLIALRAGRFDDGEASLRRAVALNPDFAEGWTNLASISLHRGDFDEAESRARRAVRVDPDFAVARAVLIRALVATGRLDAARDQVRRLLVVLPEEALSHALDALVSFVDGDEEATTEALERAFDHDAECSLALEVRGRLRLARGEFQGAESDLRAGLSARFDDPDLRYFLALALMRSGDVDHARDELESILSRHPEHARALTAMALIELTRGHAVRACRLLDRAQSSRPDLAEIRAIRELMAVEYH